MPSSRAIRLFGQPARDQLEHLALARGQPVESARAVAPSASASHEPRPATAGSMQRLARVRGADGARELRRLDVLEQVAGGAGAERGQQAFVVEEARQHDHARCRARARAARASRRPRRAAASRGPSGRRRASAAPPASTASSPSAASPTTSIPSCSSRNAAQPLAHDRVVVDEQHADRLSHRRPPGARSCRRPAPSGSSSVPPSRSARSSIEVRPRRRERSVGVGGVEADAVVGDLEHEPRRRSSRSRTATCSAPAWRSALCSASCAMRKHLARRAPASARRRRRRRARSRCRWSAPQHLDVLAQRAARGRRARGPAGAARRSASAARRAPRARAPAARSTCSRAAAGSRSSSVRGGLGGQHERRTASG